MSGHTPWREIKRKSRRWDEYFLSLCGVTQAMSKDKRTKVGCVMVRPDRSIATTGFNGMPRGVDDSIEARYEDPAKYRYFAHAEGNAIATAAKHGVILNGCALYTSEPPCSRCATAIIQAGIIEIVYPSDNTFENDIDKLARYGEELESNREMYEEAGVSIRRVDMGQSTETL